MALPVDNREGVRILLATENLWRMRPLPRESLPCPRRHHLSISLVERAILAEGKPIYFSPFKALVTELGRI